MRWASAMGGLSPTGGRSLGRGIGVRSISADASVRETLDGSVTPLQRSFLGEPATGGSQAGAPGNRRGGTSMTFDQWLELVRTHWKREEGQTMAEYGVVLAVLTIGAVAVFTALSGGISGALNRVVGLLPS
jgi:Flp pilus assembly pilin Flp